MKGITLLLLLAAFVGLTRADLRSEFEASNKKTDRAIKTKDLKALEAAMKEIVTADFKYIEGGSTQNFKTFIGNLKMSIAMMAKIDKASSRILEMKESGEKGTGKIEHTIQAMMQTPDKKTHTTSWTGVFKEEYRKVGGKWKTSRIVPISQKYLVDGKPAGM